MGELSQSTNQQSNVFVVNNHLIVAESMKYLLEREKDFNFVGFSTDSTDAIEQIINIKPDVAIVDFMISNMSGLELVKTLKSYGSETQIVFISCYFDRDTLVEASECKILTITGQRNITHHRPFANAKILLVF